MSTLADMSGASPSDDPCSQCGHPNGAHLMHADMAYPTDGWITCPVAGCECYGTWSVDDESRAALEQARAEYLRRGADGEIDAPDT